jgi:hypothetical protein
MGKRMFWTKRQQELVEEIIKAQNEGYKNPLKHAADAIRVHYTTARNTLFRMRNNYEAMRESIDKYSDWRRRLKGRRYL